MKIILIILLIFIQNVAIASTKLNIIENLKEINNIKFNFIQKIGKKTESGSCIISYPKKILCRYEDLYKKILVSNGKSLIINSNKNNQHASYPLKKTPLNFILDKEFLIKKINESYEKNSNANEYSLNIKYENNLITVYFNNNDFNILGWETTDIYQNKVETLISNVEKNIDIDLNIFKVQNYIN
jgi:Outer membrane lipoprotein-sorting protein